MDVNLPRSQYGQPFGVVVVAASLGGITALKALISRLPAEFPIPMVIVQHMSDHPKSTLDLILAMKTTIPIHWIESDQEILAGHIYVAPQGAHTTFLSPQKLQVMPGPKVNFVRPSADLLFSSAAQVFQSRAIGVILTGRGKDGTAGAAAIKQAGGRILVQEPASCMASEMPRAALQEGVVDYLLPIERLASALVAYCMVPGAETFFAIPPHYTAHLSE